MPSSIKHQPHSINVQSLILLFGCSFHSWIGKSALLLRFCDRGFQEDFISTIGVDFKVRTITLVDGSTVRLSIWDTAGQERFRTITSSYYKSADGIFLVYDITEPDSFRNVTTSWLAEIERYTSSNSKINMVLVGNKADMTNDRAVEFRVAKDFANAHSMSFFETSARSGAGVERTFTTMAQELKASATESAPTSKTILKPSSSLSDNKTIKLKSGSSSKSSAKKGCCWWFFVDSLYRFNRQTTIKRQYVYPDTCHMMHLFDWSLKDKHGIEMSLF